MNSNNQKDIKITRAKDRPMLTSVRAFPVQLLESYSTAGDSPHCPTY